MRGPAWPKCATETIANLTFHEWKILGADKMAEWVKGFAAEHDHLSLTSRPICWQKRINSQKSFANLHMCCSMHTDIHAMHTCTHVHIQ